MRARCKKCERIGKESGTKSRREFLAILAGAAATPATMAIVSSESDVAHRAHAITA